MLVVVLAHVPCCLAKRQAGAELSWGLGHGNIDNLELEEHIYSRIYGYVKPTLPNVGDVSGGPGEFTARQRAGDHDR
ncbi:MAG: hypothetical protein JWM63_2459 [Gammaproteobacteria bacterium]|nr:hypothetical protein [Gammaproteobacteria bacterium]